MRQSFSWSTWYPPLGAQSPEVIADDLPPTRLGSALSRGRPRRPCILNPACGDKVRGSAAGGRRSRPRSNKTIGEHVSPPASVPLNPDSRLGHEASPHAQGWVTMENNSIVGIDISKDQLDIHVLPSQDSFCVPRDATGLEGLVERLLVLKPKLVVMEATGGFETIVASTLAAA